MKQEREARTAVLFGKPWGIQPSFLTEEGAPITMRRKGQRVRFFDEAGAQVGPEHANVAPAVIWGYMQGWRSPDEAPWRAGMMRLSIIDATR